MKSKFKKVAAAALAMTMCVPASAFAAETSGSFDTSFDIYSPVLTISVPTSLNIEVNPISDSSATNVKKFTVASNSIDVMNASVDVEKDAPIPVNVTVKAAITSKSEDVVTEYNTFTADPTSTKKRINLNLSQAGTAAVMDLKSGGAAAFDTDKKLDLSQYAVKTEADYGTPAKSAAITQYGSLLSMDVAGPTTSDTTNTGATYSTTAADVKASVGSFAVTGAANANADWKADDVKVAVTYNVKASQALSITTPTVAALTHTSGTTATDLEITVSGVGEATVEALALHNGAAGSYGDVVWESGAYTVDYAVNGGAMEATITIPKDDAFLGVLAGDDYKTKAQDLVIALSDGRYVVTTLTVN